MALEKTLAAVAELTTAANALIAQAQADHTNAAQAAADLAAADDTAAAAIQPVIDSINAAVTPTT